MKYPLFIFNTLTHKVEEFQPLKPGNVRMYTCGPTVNNFTHIGHLRTYIMEDVLKRVLLTDGYRVKHVLNVTDVGHLTSDEDTGEDKIEKQANLESKNAWELAEFYTNDFLSNLKKVNIILPNIICPATKHIEEQINLIKKIEERGFTYIISDGVYFDTSRLSDYGILSGVQQGNQKPTERIEVAQEKRNPNDFALWKFSPKDKKRQMEWPSPWGIGFPGWHIECAAMSMKYLGDFFDIHCGGVDHIPVHHANEIAEAEAITGKHLAKYWVHFGLLVLGENKISKSLGNLIRIKDLEERGYNPLAYRYYVYTVQYRKTATFSWEALDACQAALNNLFAFIIKAKQIQSLSKTKKSSQQENSFNIKETGELGNQEKIKKFEDDFLKSVHDDLDMPKALEIMWNFIRDYNRNPLEYDPTNVLNAFEKIDKILAFDLEKIKPLKVPPEVQKIAEKRWELKQQKQWEESDKFRQQIEELGYTIEDFQDFYLISPHKINNS